MQVKLVSYTKSADPSLVNLTDIVAYTARVSNPSNQFNTETADKLIRYLIKNKHWSPLEMVDVTLEITTTRDIARQILRHRSFSFQEFSQRYADPTKDLKFSTREARLQDTKNRQNSIETENEETKMLWQQAQDHVIMTARFAYEQAISRGIAKEQARAVLPEGLIESRIYMKGSLRSWVHYIQLRTGNGTQKEHREVAEDCAVQISQVFPMILEFVERDSQ